MLTIVRSTTLLLLLGGCRAVRLSCATRLPCTPAAAHAYLATPAHWPAVVLSSAAVAPVEGEPVDKPLCVGALVDEIFGAPALGLPLRVRWRCTASDPGAGRLTFTSAEGVAGVASNCVMDFAIEEVAAYEKYEGGCMVELTMEYAPSSALAVLATPVLALDNALAVKLMLPRAIARNAAGRDVVGPLERFSRLLDTQLIDPDDMRAGEPQLLSDFKSLVKSDYGLAEALYAGVVFSMLIFLSQRGVSLYRHCYFAPDRFCPWDAVGPVADKLLDF